MRRTLDDLNIPPNRPVSGALWAAHNHLAFAGLAALELGAKHMRGYGEFSETEAKVFDRISGELRDRLDRLAAYFAKGEDADLPPETKSTGG